MPLVLVFHGFASSAARVRETSDFVERAASEGFAVAFPSAAGLIPTWRTNSASADPDVDFSRRVVEDVGSIVEIDPERVYAAGMSNGGGMAGRLACDAGDIFAAVGAVAAAHAPGACAQVRPVPVVAFHGDADLIVPFDGVPGRARDVYAWMADRALANACDPEPDGSHGTPGVFSLIWTGCVAEVVLHVILDGGHSWPAGSEGRGLGREATVDATAIMWEFFAEHTRP